MKQGRNWPHGLKPKKWIWLDRLVLFCLLPTTWKFTTDDLFRTDKEKHGR
jgi:hypothetical protein